MRTELRNPYEIRRTDPINLYEFRELNLRAQLREGNQGTIFVVYVHGVPYIFDGNHRVSVARMMGCPLEVTIIESDSDLTTAQNYLLTTEEAPRVLPGEVNSLERLKSHLSQRAKIFDFM